MKKSTFLIIVIIFIGSIAGLTVISKDRQNTIKKNASTNQQAQEQTSPVESRTNNYQPIADDIQSGAYLVDVRTTDEYQEEHIQDAVNLPLQNIQSGQRPSNDKSAKIYVYCQSGNRSAQAKELLDNDGYTNVVDLGGINDVLQLGAKKAEIIKENQ